jgi:VWFA-related protein
MPVPIIILLMMVLGASPHGFSERSSFSGGTAQSKVPSAGQQTGPPGTIRVLVRLVPVDVAVTDKDGKPVSDLKQEDFQIFEDGQEQEIRHFSVQKLTEAVPDVSLPFTLRKVPTLELAPQSSRTFLILMGRGRFQTPFRVVDALVKFVRNDLLPQDRVAVYAYNRATDFTTDHELIARVLEGYGKMNEKIESWVEQQMSGLAAVYGIRDKYMSKSIQSEIDVIFANQDGLGYRRPPPVPSPREEKIREDARKVLAEASRAEDASKISPFDKLESDAITDLSFDEFAKTLDSALVVAQELVDCIQYLRYMEGEKHLLFFSLQGISMGDTDNEEKLARIANDARVNIDCFQTGGVPLELRWGQVFAIQAIRNISDLTGGQAGIYQDVGKTLASVNEATRMQYLLGYYPKDDNWSGRYRQISVRVKRPGVKVTFRHGYFGSDTVRPYDREEFLAYSRITSAAAYDRVLSDVNFKVNTAGVTDAAGSPQIKVDLQIDPGTIAFKTTDGRHTVRLRIVIFYADSNRRNLGEDWKTMDLNLQEETYRHVTQSSIPFSTMIPLKVPNQILKVIVYDCGSDRVGSAVVKIR